MMHEEVEAEQALYEKQNNTKSSGYLDDEFELTPNFREVEDYYFRIENEKQIIQLQNLHKNSTPIQGSIVVPASASEQFNKKMNSMLQHLDSMNVPALSQRSLQSYGFYKLGPEVYDQKKTLEAAYEHLQMNSINSKMENLTIDAGAVKQKFTNKTKSNNKMVSEQENAKKQIVSKMNKMTIHDDQL